MIGQALWFSQFLASARQMQDYAALANLLRTSPDIRPNASLLALAIGRYKTWQ